MINYNCLKIGTEVHYTGDMTNLPGFGKIVKVHGNDFYPVLYDVEIDNEEEIKVWKNLTPVSFKPSPGRRFILKSEYDEERKKKLENLKLRLSSTIEKDSLKLKSVKVKDTQYHRTTIGYQNEAEIKLAKATEVQKLEGYFEEAEQLEKEYADLIKGGKNYEEVVFESPITTNGSSHYPNSKKYFAHTRGDKVVESGKKIWREQEIQSDLLQKEGIERQFKYGTVNQPIPESEFVSRGLTKEQGLKHNQMVQREAKQLELQKSQLNPFTNDRFGERIMRERIKEKAQAGYEKYRLPTGETIGKIEGFEADQWRRTSDFQYLRDPKELKVGMEIDRGTGRRVGEDWIITDILGEGRFKAVQKSSLESKLGASTEEMLRINPHLRANAETFDLTGKSNPQYYRYRKWCKFLKNKFGAKEIVDLNESSWYEVDLLTAVTI